MPAVETVHTETVLLQSRELVAVGHCLESRTGVQRVSLVVTEDTVVVDWIRIGSKGGDSLAEQGLLCRGRVISQRLLA